MEVILLEPKNKEELNAVKKTIKRMGIQSFIVSDENVKYLTSLKKKNEGEKGKFIDTDLERINNKEERIQSARYKLATLPKRNPKIKANMQLINESLQDIRKPKNARKKI
ncbi:MAG: hypothetical protein M3Z26_09560 [Bacteroidota bacterium]|nr:hypothetical protein [Bacteroidota bacterium]